MGLATLIVLLSAAQVQTMSSPLESSKLLLPKIAAAAKIEIPKLTQSDDPVLLVSSQPPGSIVIEQDDQLAQLSMAELTALLALEVECIKLYHAGDTRALTRVSQVLPDIGNTPLTIGGWSMEHRLAAIGPTLDLLHGLGEPEGALLTLFELERNSMDGLQLGMFEGVTGGSFKDLITETKRLLRMRKLTVKRSEVSLTYRVAIHKTDHGETYSMFGQQLLEVTSYELAAHPEFVHVLNAFFDGVPSLSDVAHKSGDLILNGRTVMHLKGFDSDLRAKDAAEAIKKAVFEYRRRIL